MRNDVAWMVHDDRNARVVVMRLTQQHAYTLARTLNVASLAAPLTVEKPARRSNATKPDVKNADAKKT